MLSIYGLNKSYLYSEVVQTSPETSIWLDIMTKAHSSCFINQGLLNNDLVLNVIDEVESIPIGSSNCEHLELAQGAVSEEVGCIGQIGEVCKSCRNVELGSVSIDVVVESIVLNFSKFGIEHQVGHCII